LQLAGGQIGGGRVGDRGRERGQVGGRDQFIQAVRIARRDPVGRRGGGGRALRVPAAQQFADFGLAQRPHVDAAGMRAADQPGQHQPDQLRRGGVGGRPPSNQQQGRQAGSGGQLGH